MEERPAGTGVKAPVQRERIALFDNVKGLLIILVVFGHIAHPVHNSNPVLSALFDIIYLFHMPLFVLVSGLFAKGAYRDGKLNVNRIISFAALGFAFQLALALVNGAALTPRRILAFTSAPWYLISMAAWYAMTPILARLGAARGMAASLAIALCWGAVDLSSGLLAISRTMAFLPCFALGYYLRPATIIELRARKGLWLAVGAAALTAGSRASPKNSRRSRLAAPSHSRSSNSSPCGAAGSPHLGSAPCRSTFCTASSARGSPFTRRSTICPS